MNTPLNDTTTANALNSAKRLDVLREWDREAKTWVARQATEAVALAGETPLTVSGVLSKLDHMPAPAGYELMRSDYKRRYHFVRRVLLAMVKQGALAGTGSLNARGRASMGFLAPGAPDPTPTRKRRLARGSDDYAILVEGSPEWAGKLESFLRENKTTAGDFEAILITKKA